MKSVKRTINKNPISLKKITRKKEDKPFIKNIYKEKTILFFTRDDDYKMGINIINGEITISGINGMNGINVSENFIQQFFRHIDLGDIPRNNIYGELFYKLKTANYRLSNIGSIIIKWKEYYQELLKHEQYLLLNFNNLPNLRTSIIPIKQLNKAGFKVYQKYNLSYNGNFFQGFLDKTNSEFDQKKVDLLLLAEKVWNNNEHLMSQLINFYISYRSNYFFSLIEIYNYNPKRLFEYIYYLQNEGLDNLSTIFELIHDYANMSSTMSMGHSWEKYPRFLRSMHDIAAKEYRSFKQTFDNMKFKNAITPLEKIVWSFDEKIDEDNILSWHIVLPQQSDDLKQEGAALNHCVASYIEKVIDGSSNIIFLRNIKEKSLITLEIIKNQEQGKEYILTQARGQSNRSLTMQEQRIIIRWASDINIVNVKNLLGEETYKKLLKELKMKENEESKDSEVA